MKANPEQEVAIRKCGLLANVSSKSWRSALPISSSVAKNGGYFAGYAQVDFFFAKYLQPSPLEQRLRDREGGERQLQTSYVGVYT